MSLADCLQKVKLDPADAAALRAAVEAKVNDGLSQEAAEKAVVSEWAATLTQGAEAYRKELGAPQPIEVLPASTEGLRQPKVVVVGAAELGNTVASRHKFFEASTKADRDMERRGKSIPALKGTTIHRENGRPVIMRLGDMSGSDVPHLVEGGQGEPYFIAAPFGHVLSASHSLTPGALSAEVDNEAAVIMNQSVDGLAVRAGDSMGAAFTKVAKILGEPEAARLMLDTLGGKSFELDTFTWEGADGRLHAVTQSYRLVDPVTRTDPVVDRNKAYNQSGGRKILLDGPGVDATRVFKEGQDKYGAREFLSPVKVVFPADHPTLPGHIQFIRGVTDAAQTTFFGRDNGGDFTTTDINPAWITGGKNSYIVQRLKDVLTIRENGGHGTLLQRDRGSVNIVGDAYIVNLFPGHDLSTILHETGHIMLEELRTLISTGMASPQTEELYGTLRRYLGNRGEPITREQHEKMATSFEAYLLEGKAPTAALAKPFAAFRRWLTATYEKVVAGDALKGLAQVAAESTGEAAIRLTPEVRDVFDRLLGLNGEVEEATADAEFTIHQVVEQIPEEIRSKHKVRIKTLLNEAKTSMEERLFEARARAINGQKAGWRKSAEEAVARNSTYAAIEFLKTTPLDRTTVQSDYGDAVFKALSHKHGNLLTSSPDQDGMSPDEAASRYGFADGKALADAIRKAKTVEGAIRAGVKAQADLAWAQYGPAEAMAETPEFIAVMEASRAYLAEALGRPAGLDKRAIRRQAEAQINGMPLKEATQVDRFLQNMARLQRQERAAVVKGDLPRALELNALARNQFELARLSRQVKAEANTIIGRARRLAKFDPKKVERQYGLNATAIAERYGIIKPSQATDRKSLRALFEAAKDKDNAEFEPVSDLSAAFPDWILDEQRSGDFRNMSIGELHDIDQMMRLLIARGAHLRGSDLLRGKAKIENVVAEMLESMSSLSDKQVYEEGTKMREAADRVDSFLANLNIWQFRVRAMDGFTTGADKTGPAETYMFDPLAAAAADRFLRFKQISAALKEPMQHLSDAMKAHGKYVDVDVTVPAHMRAIGRNGWTFENLITVALNMGNSYNMEGMAKGLGFTLEDGSADVSRLYELTSLLTAKDWHAVQSILDAINSLHADLSAVFERRNGFPLAKVEAEPITVHTADGQTITLPGGYYPVKFDPALSHTDAERQADEELKSSPSAAFRFVGTRSGMTNARTDTGGRPLLMTFGGMASHFQDTIQYISTSEAIADVYKMSKHPAFREVFTQKFGPAAYSHIRTLLADIGLPDTKTMDTVDQLVGWLKGTSTAWALGANVKTALTQPFAVFNYAAEEGWAPVLSGLKEVTTRGVGPSIDLMFRLSPYMEERWTASDRDVLEQLKKVDWLNKPKLRRTRDAMFSLIQTGDRAALLPLWFGSFNKRLALGQSEAEAALGANKAIGIAYPGASRTLDQSEWLRSKSGVKRLLSSFATAAFHYGNRQRFYFNGVRQGKITPSRYFAHVANEVILGPLLMQVFFQVLWGNFPPEDKDHALDYVKDLALYQFIGLPILREVSNAATYPGKGVGDNVPAFQGLTMLAHTAAVTGQLIVDFSDEKTREKALWAYADLISFGLKLPASRVAARVKEGWRQVDEFDNDDHAFEWLEDVFTILSPDPDKRGH
jgi:hypothetical protein